jgi:Acetyltransferase (GNAT) domain
VIVKVLDRPLEPVVDASVGLADISVTRYAASCKSEWDQFVEAGKNATFMFRRDYMDYHADRFEDHSLVIRKDDRIVGLLPANRRDAVTVVSHQGLTYGGFVLRRDATLSAAIDIVRASLAYLDALAIHSLIYKRLPRFYNTLPDDEIDYALFLLDAKLARRDCSLVLLSADRLPVSRGKKSKINKGSRAGLSVVEETTFEPFWRNVLEPRLWERFEVKPVHTVDEIGQLAARLPQHIKQYSAYAGDAIVAGITIYETQTVAHAQYIAVTAEGEELSALDYLCGWLISERYKDKAFFDFGICNEREGRTLNHGLLQFKESFGARSFAHDFYTIDTADHGKLAAVLPPPASSTKRGDA